MIDPGGPFMVAVECGGQIGTKVIDTWEEIAEAMLQVTAFMPTWDKVTIVRASTIRPESSYDDG